MAVSGEPPGTRADPRAAAGAVAADADPEAPPGTPLLILRALGLGDLLATVPALRALQRAFPDRRRLLATPPELAPLAALIGPDPSRLPAPRERAVTAIVPLPAWVGGALAPDPGVAADLPRGTVAVNLHGRGPASHRLLLATAPRRLIAFAHPAVPESADGPPWERPASGGGAGDGARRAARHHDGEEEHERARWCRLLAAAGIDADPDALGLPAPADPPPADVRGATIIHPGAASAARRWPGPRWAEVARAERRAGRTVLLTGSPSERPLAEAVADAAGLSRAAVLAGRTRGLAQLAAVIAAAGRVVCGDTGVAHLATAFGTPSVVLFGPVPPAAWGPPPRHGDRHVALWAGERGDPHAAAPDRGLLAITPADVLDALARLPEPPAGAGAAGGAAAAALPDRDAGPGAATAAAAP